MLIQLLIGFYKEYKIVIKETGFVLRCPQVSLFPPTKSIHPNCLFYTLELDNVPHELLSDRNAGPPVL